MADAEALIPLGGADLSLGKPLPWPIYDAEGALLIIENFIFKSQEEIFGVIKKGAYRQRGDDLFVAVTPQELQPGAALPWPIYDRRKHLLQKEGHIFTSREQIERALLDGLFRRKSGILSKRDRDLLQAREAAEEARLTDEKNRGQFDEMSARIGDPLLLQVKSAFAEERGKARLIGYVPKRTVIIEAPVGDTGSMALRVGQSVIARSFSGKLAYGFETMVKAVCNTPITYCHLLYPDFVQKVPVRESARVSFNVIGSATVLADDNAPEAAGTATSFSVLLVDFSTSGAAFVAATGAVARGKVVRISFRVRIQDIEVMPTLECIIRSSSVLEGESAGKSRYGVQFKEMNMQDKLILQSMVYQKMLENV